LNDSDAGLTLFLFALALLLIGVLSTLFALLMIKTHLLPNSEIELMLVGDSQL
jgi:hypothetical protein